MDKTIQARLDTCTEPDSDHTEVQVGHTRSAKVAYIHRHDLNVFPVYTGRIRRFKSFSTCLEVLKIEDLKIEDLKIEDLKIEDLKIEDLKIEDLKIEDLKIEDLKI